LVVVVVDVPDPLGLDPADERIDQGGAELDALHDRDQVILSQDAMSSTPLQEPG
jgi:hypothetical protein